MRTPVTAVLLVVASLAAMAPVGAQAGSPRTAQPVVLIGEHVSLIAGAPDVLARASDSALVARAFAACHVTAPPEVQEGRVVPGVDTSGAYIVLMVVPRAATPAACDATASEGAALLARAIRLVDPMNAELLPDVASVSAHVRGGPPLVATATRVPTIVTARPGMRPPAPSTLVVLLPAGAFAPDAGGQLPDVTFELSLAGSTTAVERLTMSSYFVRMLWFQGLAGQLARLGETASASPPLHLPQPADTALRSAHALHAGGSRGAAAVVAVARLGARQTSDEDRLIARLIVADALLAGGDTIGARVPLAEALVDAPCLTLGSASPAYARLLDDLRPRDVRCTVTPLRRVALAAMVPGLGYAVTGHRIVAWQVGAGTALLGALTFAMHVRGDAEYDRYVDAENEGRAAEHYNHADELRTSASGLGVATALAWVLSGINAVRAEHGHRAEVARVREFDMRTPRMSMRVRPDAAAGALRMEVRATW